MAKEAGPERSGQVGGDQEDRSKSREHNDALGTQALDGGLSDLVVRDDDGRTYRPWIYLVIDSYSKRIVGVRVSKTEVSES
jgi:hypothetical protein